MVIKVFGIRTKKLMGPISDKELILRYNQDNGITLMSEKYPGLQYNVRFKDIMTGDVQLYE